MRVLLMDAPMARFTNDMLPTRWRMRVLSISLLALYALLIPCAVWAAPVSNGAQSAHPPPSKAESEVAATSHSSGQGVATSLRDEATPPQFTAPPPVRIGSRISRQQAAADALEHNEVIAQAALALTRAQTELTRAKGRNDGVFRTGLDAMRAETPVDSGISRGTNRQDVFQLNSSLSRRFDSGTTLSMEMQNGYTRTVFPLVIAGVLTQQIDSGPNYLNSLTLSLNQSLLEGRSRAVSRTADIAAEIQVRIAQTQLRAAKEQVVQQIMNTWSQVFFAEAQLVLQERSHARTQQQIAAADAQLKAGHIAPFERNLIWQRLAQNQEALLVAHQELRSTARALMLALGRAPQQGLVLTTEGKNVHGQEADTPLKIASVLASASSKVAPVLHQELRQPHTEAHDEVSSNPLVEEAASHTTASRADQWCEQAMEHNADIDVASAQMTLAEAMLLPAREQKRSQLDLRFGVTSSGLDPDIGQSLKKMATVDALTIFGGIEFATRIRNRSAKAEFEAVSVDLASARAHERHLRQQVCYEVVDAWERVELQQQRRGLAQWRTQVAYEGLHAESARFKQGRSTVTQVLDALENVDMSELEHVRVGLDEDTAWWALQRHVGGILREAGLRMETR